MWFISSVKDDSHKKAENVFIPFFLNGWNLSKPHVGELHMFAVHRKFKFIFSLALRKI